MSQKKGNKSGGRPVKNHIPQLDASQEDVAKAIMQTPLKGPIGSDAWDYMRESK